MNTVANYNQQSGNGMQRPAVRPVVDIIETEDDIVVTAEMPGVNDESADVTLERNVLTIRGTATPNIPEGFEDVHTEWAAADFERTFSVSDVIDRDGIDAEMKDGVLTLKLPKSKKAKPQKITIKAG